MQCPVDQTVLQMSERQGIEIDYCPTCRGVWLDRGELDKIIERDNAGGGAAPRQDPPATAPTQAQPARPPVAPPPDPYESVGYPQQGYQQQRYRYGSPGSPDSPDYRHGGYQQGHRRRRKGGFLGDLFDFD